MNKVRFACFLFVLTGFFTNLQAQSPYQLNKNNEVSYFVTSLGFGLTATYLNSQVSPLTQADLAHLAPNDVVGYDRNATRFYSSNARQLSDHLQTASVLLPLTFLVPKRTRNDFNIIGTMALEVFTLNLGITNIFKNSVQRLRPFVYNESVPDEEKLTVNAKMSFFSGHTSNYTALSFFTAKVISDYCNNKNVKIAAWTLAAGSSALMGYLRVRGGKHFTSDVVLGYLVGGTIGYLIPELHKVSRNGKLTISPLASFDVVGMNLRLNLGT